MKLDIKHAIQRAIRGYDDMIFWSLRDVIAEQMVIGLEFLASDDAHGYPACFDSKDQWDEILNEIKIGFELVVADNNGEVVDDDEMKKALDKSFDLLKEWYLGLWD